MELPGLSFHPGVGVQAAIRERFGLPVTSSGVSSSVFFLVASFGLASFFSVLFRWVFFLRPPLEVLLGILAPFS